VYLHLGKTISVANASHPMLEVFVEFDSDTASVQNNDIVYLMPVNDLLPRYHIELEK
jgi:hypothetical protein